MSGTCPIPRARISARILNTLLSALKLLGNMTVFESHPMNTAPCIKKQWKLTLRPMHPPSFRLRGNLTFRLIDPLPISVVFSPVVLTTLGLLLATIVMLCRVTPCLMACVVPQSGLAPGAWVSLKTAIVGLSLVSVLKLLINLVRTCSMCYGLVRS